MKPRVFVSSTFYDLKFVREELASFIRSYGFDPIMFEDGDVGYIYGENLDQSCYKEMRNADMAVLIIGGKYGSPASGEDPNFNEYLSVTRKEFITAVNNKIPLYAFVDRDVLSEYNVYKKNKHAIDSGEQCVQFPSTDNINVFRFIGSIYEIGYISIIGFSETQEIKIFLQKQWADIFKRYLLSLRQQENEEKIVNSVNQIEVLLRRMGVMVQKMGDIVIGEEPQELKKVVDEQQVESIASIIANSVEFLVLPQSMEKLYEYFNAFVEKIAQGCELNTFTSLLSDDEETQKHVNDFLASDTENIILCSIKRGFAFSLEPYKEEIVSRKYSSQIVDKLMQKEYLEKMKITPVITNIE